MNLIYLKILKKTFLSVQACLGGYMRQCVRMLCDAHMAPYQQNVIRVKCP